MKYKLYDNRTKAGLLYLRRKRLQQQQQQQQQEVQQAR